MRVKVQPLRAVLAGLVACAAMVLYMWAMPHFGAPKLNIFALFSTLTADYNWWTEPLEYVALGGVVFPLLYATMLFDDLPGKKPWQKGMSWGLILWFLRGAVVSPLMGESFFSMKASFPVITFIEVLVAHLIYGFVLGALAGRKPVGTRPVHTYHIKQTANR